MNQVKTKACNNVGMRYRNIIYDFLGEIYLPFYLNFYCVIKCWRIMNENGLYIFHNHFQVKKHDIKTVG